MRISSVLVLLTLGVSTSGCVAVAAGAAGTYAYIQYDKNEAFQDFEGELDNVWDVASEVVLDDGFVAKEKATRDPSKRVLEGTGIKVTVERQPQGYTRVRVRVGTFATEDHRRRATLLLEEIGKRV